MLTLEDEDNNVIIIDETKIRHYTPFIGYCEIRMKDGTTHIINKPYSDIQLMIDDNPVYCGGFRPMWGK